MTTVVEPDLSLLEAVVAQVWTAMLSAESTPWTGALPADYCGPSARIRVRGDWSAEVVIATTDVGAHSLTRWLLRGDLVTREDIDDALGEVLNVVAGSLKGALGGSSRLGLPIRGTERLVDVVSTPPHLTVSWGGEPVVLAIRPVLPERNTQ